MGTEKAKGIERGSRQIYINTAYLMNILFFYFSVLLTETYVSWGRSAVKHTIIKFHIFFNLTSISLVNHHIENERIEIDLDSLKKPWIKDPLF